MIAFAHKVVREAVMSFPRDFIWGAAAASYQIEGAALEDGKGLSIWDMMCRQPGKIWEDNTGDISCDHYHRYQEDIRLMAEIGLKAYRLSISWPRVIPEGTGTINQKGLDYYDRLIDALLEEEIQPWVTLFHWDYPYSLFKRGGWLSPDSSDWFAEYTKVMVDKLSDRVACWMTLNEPQVFIDIGHRTGRHAPGLQLDMAEVLIAAHNALLAHGKAVQIIRQQAKTKPTIGAAPVGITYYPVTENPSDIESARQRMFSIIDRDCWNNTWFADPMILGKYPEDGLSLFHNDLPYFKEKDMEIIQQPLDFYGANIYHGQAVRTGTNKNPEILKGNDGPALTTMGWRVAPEALYWGPRFLYERYKLPIIVTENGMANCDWLQQDGKVHDPQRIDFLRNYLKKLRQAIDDGTEVKGYFQWSLTDNFEWGHGYSQRFGLIYIDYTTGKRTLKDSAYWYKELIASNGKVL
jgi:beta-glucosidase